MPTPVKPFVIPDWANPANASVLDSPLHKAARTIGQFLGINDPQSQIMGLATAPIDVPGPSHTIRAFHGSPHNFERFDLSKIGTGEGAQAYGHGLYFAENEGVARGYRENLAKNTPTWANPDNAAKYDPFTLEAIKRELQKGQSVDDIIKMNAQYSKVAAQGRPNLMADMHDALKSGDVKLGGATYEVNIHASPDELLDWDKPLSQQPQKVQEALEKAGARDAIRKTLMNPDWVSSPISHEDAATGADIYSAMRDKAVGFQAGANIPYAKELADATQILKDAGIKGIQYLDQGSRSAGEGTRNFVIFDDKIIEIAKKYGISLPAAASLYKTWQQYGAPDEKGVK